MTMSVWLLLLLLMSLERLKSTFVYVEEQLLFAVLCMSVWLCVVCVFQCLSACLKTMETETEQQQELFMLLRFLLHTPATLHAVLLNRMSIFV